MLKKLSKSIIIITIIFILLLSGNIMKAIATTQADLNNLQNKIDDTKQNIDEVEEKISDTMKQVQTLSGQIAGYENEITDLNTKIDNVTTQINEAEEKLKKAEEDYNKQEEMFKNRLVALYEAGDTSYLDVLLSSKSITDFISKYYLVSEIADTDKNLLEQMEKEKLDIEEAKKTLETSKQQIEALKTNKEDTAKSLKNSQEVKQNYVDQLEDKEKDLEKQLQEMEVEEKRLKQELDSKANKYANEIANLGGNGTLQKPISGGVITATMYYSSGIYHGALDWGIPVGTKVYAAEEGIVLNAGWSNSGYGYHIWIQHANGIRTCYGHGNGTFYVSEGQKVERGQLIMLSGNSGKSTGPHLHFEVRVAPYDWRSGGGDSRRDPRNYL